MKSSFIIPAILSVLLVGCVSNARIETLEKRLVRAEEENKRLRQANADGYQPPGAPTLPAPNPSGPSVSGSAMSASGTPGAVPGAMPNGGAAGGVMWARPQHGVYMGAVGTSARQMTGGPKIRFTNDVCDRGSRNVWSKCWNRDRIGSIDLNSYLSIKIDGQPVVCQGGFQHPVRGILLLPPGQSCWVEVGYGHQFKVTISAYRNVGNDDAVMLKDTPDRTTMRTISVEDASLVDYGVDETRF